MAQRDSNSQAAAALAVKPDALNWCRKLGNAVVDDDRGATAEGGGLEAIAGQSSSRCFHSERNLFMFGSATAQPAEDVRVANTRR